MDVKDWLHHAAADAEHRGLPQLRALLEALARSTATLREVDARLRQGEDARR